MNMTDNIEIDFCERCGAELDPDKVQWLEFDRRTSTYGRGVPPEHSQGGFPFGKDCAAAALAEHAKAYAANRRPKRWYRDLVTGKLRYTRGVFAGWTEPIGPLSVPYAVFQRPQTSLFVPAYLLTPETRTALQALAEHDARGAE